MRDKAYHDAVLLLIGSIYPFINLVAFLACFNRFSANDWAVIATCFAAAAPVIAFCAIAIVMMCGKNLRGISIFGFGLWMTAVGLMNIWGLAKAMASV
jgi:hypothetical protein